jgi:hypothetical protein
MAQELAGERADFVLLSSKLADAQAREDILHDELLLLQVDHRQQQEQWQQQQQQQGQQQQEQEEGVGAEEGEAPSGCGGEEATGAGRKRIKRGRRAAAAVATVLGGGRASNSRGTNGANGNGGGGEEVVSVEVFRLQESTFQLALKKLEAQNEVQLVVVICRRRRIFEPQPQLNFVFLKHSLLVVKHRNWCW